MKLRRRSLLALAASLVLAGCVDGAPGTADDGDAPAGDGVEANGDLVPVDRGPVLPPLHPAIDDWDETVVSIRTTAGATPTVDAKVAVTTGERRRGLMEVEELPDGSGMLFLFDDERTGGFWMRNTLVPLDIAYIDANGVIGTVLAMDPCDEPAASDCPTYVPEEPYVTALEVPQGWFEQVGVAEGDPVAWAQPGR
jgi:uncharacterized protein